MEINHQEHHESKSLSTGVFEISGEPAIVINGVPGVPPWNTTFVLSSDTTNTTTSDNKESQRNTGFGRWLVGREVKKQFGDQYYSGTVTEFNKKTGWYRVGYEDGDFEDLEWSELEDALMPLDIMIPVKALALKIIKKSQKKNLVGKSGPRKMLAPSKNRQTKKVGQKRKVMQGLEAAPSLMIERADHMVTEDVKNDEQH